MLSWYHRAFRVVNNTNHRGLIQNLYHRFPHLYSLEWSTLSQEKGSLPTDACILNPNTYCLSENEINSSVTINFPYSLLNLTGLTFMSCRGSRCLYHFDIYIQTKNDEWLFLKEVHEEEEYFKQTLRFIEIKSQIQLGIRYIDVYGDLLMLKPSFLTFCMKNLLSGFSPFFISLLCLSI